MTDDIVQLEDLTVAQLQTYAEDHGIDLGDARLKAEIVDVISRAPVPPATGDGPGVQVDDFDEDDDVDEAPAVPEDVTGRTIWPGSL